MALSPLGMAYKFLYDWLDVTEERRGSGVVLRQFIHGAGVDQPVILDGNLDGDATATGVADQWLHYLQDGQGSVVGLVDDDGALVEGYLYGAYGQPLPSNLERRAR